MTTGAMGTSVRLPASFVGFPGIVVLMAADGTIVASNGCLEHELERPVVGTSVAAALDGGRAETSGRAYSTPCASQARRRIASSRSPVRVASPSRARSRFSATTMAPSCE